MEHEDFLNIGIIQTNLDCDTAWHQDGVLRKSINEMESRWVLEEIRKGFSEFYNQGLHTPRVVVIPELSIPWSGLKKVERFARVIDAVVVGGCDFKIVGDEVRNQGVLIIPNKWPSIDTAYANTKMFFGKRYFAEDERKYFSDLGLNGIPENTIYILDAGCYGNIGIAICADFYDLERFVIYRGKIHHLIIIAYNKDYKSFDFLSEAISRLLLCNVIICNTGHYGNSLATSPYVAEYKRTIFRSSGPKLFTSQIISLPVNRLNIEQTMASKSRNSAVSEERKHEFKWPPGYEKFNEDNENP